MCDGGAHPVEDFRVDSSEGLLEGGVAGRSGEAQAPKEEGSVEELSDEVPVAELGLGLEGEEDTECWEREGGGSPAA